MMNEAAATWFRSMNAAELTTKIINMAGRWALTGTRPGADQIAEAMLAVVTERCGVFGEEGHDTDEMCKHYRRELLPMATKLRVMAA